MYRDNVKVLQFLCLDVSPFKVMVKGLGFGGREIIQWLCVSRTHEVSLSVLFHLLNGSSIPLVATGTYMYISMHLHVSTPLTKLTKHWTTPQKREKLKESALEPTP